MTTKALAAFEGAYQTLIHTRPGILASEAGGELSWLKTARERDAARWRKDGLPTRREERWKYTSLKSIADSHISLARQIDGSQLPLRSSFPGYAGESSAEVVFVNGHFVPAWSKLDASTGVSITVLSQLVAEAISEGWTQARRDRFRPFREHVESSVADRETVFAALNTSLMQDGVLIQVSKGTVLKKPIVVTFLSSSETTSSDFQPELQMASPRVFAHLESGAEAALVEYYSGDSDGRYFSNAVSDIRLEQAARLSHVKIQAEGAKAVHIGTSRIHLSRNSWCETFQFSLSGELSRNDLHATLEGEGAHVTLDGLYLLDGTEHVDNSTSVDHLVPHTTSDQLYKGILSDRSRAVFNGRVHIHRDAQQSFAGQLNNNLMLSLKSEVDTKPELDIDADDVKASHGATIGQIDPEHLFYLQARAIPKAHAIKMLARGFAHDVVFRMSNESMREAVRKMVDSKFDSMKIEEVLK